MTVWMLEPKISKEFPNDKREWVHAHSLGSLGQQIVGTSSFGKGNELCTRIIHFLTSVKLRSPINPLVGLFVLSQGVEYNWHCCQTGAQWFGVPIGD